MIKAYKLISLYNKTHMIKTGLTFPFDNAQGFVFYKNKINISTKKLNYKIHC